MHLSASSLSGNKVVNCQNKEAPGFDKDDWPNTADPKWQSHVNSFYSD